MRKCDELERGCMAKAMPNEMTFVLLGRDAAAPVAIRAWIAERVRTGKNHPADPKIVEAEACARTMEAEQREGPPVRVAPAPPPDEREELVKVCRDVLATATTLEGSGFSGRVYLGKRHVDALRSVLAKADAAGEGRA